VNLESFEAFHVCGGRALIQMADGSPDLDDNPDLWRALWERHREGLLAGWIRTSPGSRPLAFWMFDADDFPERTEDESEVEYLHRLDLLEPAEVEAITKRARDFADYNSCRSPVKTAAGYKDNFIPPGDLEIFAASQGRLAAEELAYLDLQPAPLKSHSNGKITVRKTAKK
jgi:hypothetical protein